LCYAVNDYCRIVATGLLGTFLLAFNLNSEGEVIKKELVKYRTLFKERYGDDLLSESIVF